jgi:hypothetical protein
MAPDYLAISKLPVKKVICAFGRRMYQLLLAPTVRSRPRNLLSVPSTTQAGSRATQVTSTEGAQSRHAPASFLDRLVAISGKLLKWMAFRWNESLQHYIQCPDLIRRL